MELDQPIDDDGVSNPTSNRTFADVLDANMKRRQILKGSLAAAATGFFAMPAFGKGPKGHGESGAKGKGKPGKELIGFTALPIAQGFTAGVTVSADYEFDVLIPWGTEIDGEDNFDVFDQRNNSAEDQANQIGIGHDGMWFFPLFRSNSRGMLAINHEFGRNSHVLGKAAPESLEDVRKSQHAHGVSVVEIAKRGGRWTAVPSDRARRIHGNTPVEFSGPVAGSDLLANAAGNAPQGTLNNCGNGYTPWGTYLTCEENFNGYFGANGAYAADPRQARYGLSANGFGYGWHLFDPRFDLNNADYANEANRFGWIVEIDPFDASKPAVKRTAMGRFKHESAALTIGKGGRAVAYMGDDERFDYIYKFVSADNHRSMLARGISPLDEGKLYVAVFNDDGTGQWRELTIEDAAIRAAGFTSQAEVLTFARAAADAVGATRMDRPEWGSVAPNGDVYFTLTNNSRRAPDDTNAANPLGPNPHGHIIRFHDTERHTGEKFAWEIFLLSAQDTHGTEQSFGSPDGLWADDDGRVFIQTDGNQSEGGAIQLNNQMLVADPVTKDIRRMLAGPFGCEVTGFAITPDRRTLFANIQHPGNGAPAVTNWPASDTQNENGPIPRDATVVIRRRDGGIVGS